MRTSTISPRALLGGLMLFTSGLSYAACSSDSGTTTSTGNQPVTASASGTGGSTSASTTASGTGGASGSTTTSSSASGTGGAGGCFAGTPTTNDQFLNSCNGQTCQHYDNSQLTKLSTDGGLPPLP